MIDDPVHATGASHQPYIRVVCTDQEHYVYAQPEGLPPGVYRADWCKDTPISADTPLYTFDDAKVTCQACARAGQRSK